MNIQNPELVSDSRDDLLSEVSLAPVQPDSDAPLTSEELNAIFGEDDLPF